MNIPFHKISLGLLLATLLTGHALAAPKIVVQVQLCEVPAETKLPRNILQVLKQKGVDTVTLPKMVTPSGKTATCSVVREFRVAGKGVFQPGTVLTVRPTLQPRDRFHYSVDISLTEFQGFVKRSTTQAPIFTTQKTIGIDGTCARGEVVWFDFGGIRVDQQTVSEKGQKDRLQIVRSKYLAILRFDKN